MEQKDIDIYEILKNEEYGTELYTPKCGRVWHSGMANDKDSAKAIWKKEKEEREQSAFKTFDKVLVSNGEEYNWQPAFFVSDRGEGAIYRYNVLPIQSGKVADFAFCIPFEGNEHLTFTSDPF